MRYQVACAQFAPTKARLPQNLDQIARFALVAADAQADVLVFPESSTTGYFLEGGVLECALTADALAAELLARLGNLARPIDLVVGFYERDEEMLYNSAAYLEAGPGKVEVRHVYKKFFLPTYGVFDEERFVSTGNEIAVFETRFGTAGLLICEDVWHSIMPTLCAMAGAEILYVPSASPARGFTTQSPDNIERYARLLQGIAEEHGMYVVNSMLLGFEGGKGFAGGSAVYDPEGYCLARSPILEEHLILAEVDRNRITQTRAQDPLLNDLKSRWATVLKIAEDLS